MKKTTCSLSLLLCSAAMAFAMPSFDGTGPEPRFNAKGIRLNQANPRTKGTRIAGTWKALVILIDFPDYRWDHQADSNFVNDSLWYTPAHFDSMMNSRNSYSHPGSGGRYTGSFRDFYLENSYGVFDVATTVTVWYTAPNNFAYYSANTGGRAYELVEQAVAAADPAVDFSQFDNNGDGWVDALFVAHAGPGAEALPEAVRANYIWSHASGISPQTRDGVTVSDYSIEPEDGKTGVFCHEFGHVIGLPDLYDYTYLSSGVGEWCCMAGGSWCHRDSADPRGTAPSQFSVWCKRQLGWVTPAAPAVNLLQTAIPPIETSPVAYRLWDNGDTTGQEYFLVENRQNIGFDTGFTRRQLNYGLARGHGLLIWHVDTSVYGNDDRTHKMVDLEEASPVAIGGSFLLEHLDTVRTLPLDRLLWNGNRGDDGDPWPGYWSAAGDTVHFNGPRAKDAFNHLSAPSSDSYTGATTLAGVEGITEQGTTIVADLFVSVGAVVRFPAAGAMLRGGSDTTITWRSSAAGGIAWDSLYYSVNGGSAWAAIGRFTGDSSAIWHVPSVNAANCLIKVVSANNNGIKAVHTGGTFSISIAGVADGATPGSPAVTALERIQPNPASGGAVIRFDLSQAGPARVGVYNALGQEVRSWTYQTAAAGRHQLRWDLRDRAGAACPSGIYFIRLETARQTLTNRMTVIH